MGDVGDGVLVDAKEADPGVEDQAAVGPVSPSGAKCSQIVDKICIWFDDGYRETSESDVVDAAFPSILQRDIDFASECIRSTAE